MGKPGALVRESPASSQRLLADLALQLSRWKERNLHLHSATAVDDRVRMVEAMNGPEGAGDQRQIELVGSSNGCASFTVHLGNRRLKCYECLTPRRASIVYDLSSVLRRQGVEMPECVGVQGNLVVSEWVDGRPLADIAEAEKIELMAAYQAKIHGAAIPARFKRHRAMPHARWLFARVRRFGREAVDDARVVRLRDRLLRARPEGAPWGVLHPDVITTNLIVTDRGVVSIDNEFLCVGHGQEWDILNTVKVSFPEQSRLQERYLNAYAKHRSLHTLMSHRNYWEALYDIKMAGKRLSEGESDAGLRHLQAAAEAGLN